MGFNCQKCQLTLIVTNKYYSKKKTLILPLTMHYYIMRIKFLDKLYLALSLKIRMQANSFL